MIFCARATRGLQRPSHGLMARPGKSIAKHSEGRAGEKYLPVGGRVRKSRAVEDQSVPIPEEITSEPGRIIRGLAHGRSETNTCALYWLLGLLIGFCHVNVSHTSATG